jgi:hypothetical protein
MEARMTPFTWRDEDYLMVTAVVARRCTGCVFAHTDDDKCPHTEEADVNCDAATNDIIFIRNTPEAITEYALRRLEGE